MVWKSGKSGGKQGKAGGSGGGVYNGTNGMHVTNPTYKAQNGIPLGKIFANCHTVYGGGTTPQ